MAEKKTLEGKVNTLQKDMSMIIKVVKEISGAVKKLEDKVGKDENSEIHAIIENQKVVEKKLAENSESIKILEREISKLENKQQKKRRSKPFLKYNWFKNKRQGQKM